MLRTYVAYSVQKLRTVRKPVASHRALDRRKKILVLGVALMLGLAGALAVLLVGCGGGSFGGYDGHRGRRPARKSFGRFSKAECAQLGDRQLLHYGRCKRCGRGSGANGS